MSARAVSWARATSLDALVESTALKTAPWLDCSRSSADVTSLCEHCDSDTLIRLDCSGNRIVDVGPLLLRFTSLELLNAASNLQSVFAFRASSGPGGRAACHTRLTDLDLSNNDLTRLPDVSGLPALRRLHLSGNAITCAAAADTNPNANHQKQGGGGLWMTS